MYATTREALNQATASFVRVEADWGLTVSLVKSKVLVAGNHLEPTDTMLIQLDGGLIDVVLILEVTSQRMVNCRMRLLYELARHPELLAVYTNQSSRTNALVLASSEKYIVQLFYQYYSTEMRHGLSKRIV